MANGNQNLNTDVSVVDFLKSRGEDASFSARAKRAVQEGIVQSTGQFRGTAEQNTALLNRIRAQTPSTPSAVGSEDEASRFINQNQDEDIASAKATDEPPTRSLSDELLSSFQTLTGRDSLLPSFDAPDLPKFEEQFASLRQKFNVDQLENTINDLDAQEQEIRARLRQRTNAELDKPVALNVIEGRVGETERQEMERLDFIGRAKQRAVNQLQTANDAISNVMTFRKMDYEAAKNAYDTEFSQNITLFNTIKGVADTALTEAQRDEDNARANLQIIYNSIQDGGINVDTVDAATEVKINSLELKAGLPQGFYKNLAEKKPDAKVLSTTTRTSGGSKFADVIYKNPDGSLTTESIRIGAADTGSDRETESQFIRRARSEIAGELNSVADENGHVTPAQYKKARSSWVSGGFSAKDFDEAFANQYLDLDDFDEAGVSLFD